MRNGQSASELPLITAFVICSCVFDNFWPDYQAQLLKPGVATVKEAGF